MRKTFKWFTTFIAYFLGLLLVIGFYKFPTAPMKLCGQGYCDKMGNAITENTYNLFFLLANSMVCFIYNSFHIRNYLCDFK